MGGSLRLGRLGAVALLLVGVAACAAPLEQGERAVHYDSVGELVAGADAVVIGRVAETSRGGSSIRRTSSSRT